ncbi:MULTISPECIES: hypothetical protein [Cohnella]|uniref:hypothetical protein n=1 Tax=Cohnella TaxID=329857 RepID=UPI001119AE7F|nr:MULTISPECIES: hypothetical protein [Cohnella]MBN2983722.1 hypothetical protein [Cohnella algarum]
MSPRIELYDASNFGFPDYAVAFRSLNPALNGGELERLRSRKCLLVPSRQIYLSSEIAALSPSWNIRRFTSGICRCAGA